ncbi:MAG: hypothetical protein IJH04_01985 [Eggerthellaceae bacterium]|nr:hypothetical protein [Eggerthellaceae bacterium]
MHVEPAALESLLELQRIDLELLAVGKKREDLPQRAIMEDLSKKRELLQGKAAQVDALKEKASSEMTKVETEDSNLAEKQRKAQELIDAAGNDYRSVESHSKELSGFAKRRDTLSERIDALSAELGKISAVQSQIQAALDAVNREFDSAKASFESEDGQLEAAATELGEKRAGIVDGLSAELVNLYTKTAQRSGGVALGRLNDNVCGVCRSVIDGGRLIELRAAAPLGVCPSCKRLLIIEANA